MTDVGLSDELRNAIVDAYMADLDGARDAIAATVRRLVAAADDLDDVAFIADVVDAVMDAQRAAGAYGVEYVNTLALDDVIVDAARYVGRATRDDTLLETIYHRPGADMAERIAAGMDAAEARAIAERDFVALADTDVAMAARLAETEAMTASANVTGYNRVPDAGACSFCILIADRGYRTDELAPAHNFCRCGIEPILTGSAESEFVGAVDWTPSPDDYTRDDLVPF